MVVVDADDAAEEQVGRLAWRIPDTATGRGRRGRARKRARRRWPSRARGHATRAAEYDADDERAPDHPDHRVEPDDERAGRAREAELGDGMHGEAEAARDDEDADRTGDDRDDAPPAERCVDEVLL